ncbi:OmpW family protein [Moraxella sp. VT-16-12]|uniref:OmpW/AlkL family protein n=1 Tax=Moraxella sp. VT-16-12 TaxID=2014877 RepID=UPI0011B40992|nr:OmpW family outer membrane protein [Moraxella sp. VT-16-12]TWV82882.1 OmpW family protein [Moraxella sp. VT-16-12]
MLKQLVLATSLIAIAGVASANLTFKAGLGYLDPTADKNINSDLLKAEVSGEAALLPSFDYRFGNTPFSAELLLATPFEHTVSATTDGAKKNIARFKHLPPTLTFKYNTPTYHGFGANVGIGATVLVPYEEKLLVEKINGTSIKGKKLEADTVVAPAAQIGVTYSPTNSPWGVFADVRYADLKTDLELDGRKIGELEVNPVVYSVGVSHKF